VGAPAVDLVPIALSDDVAVKFAVLGALCSEVATGLGKGHVEAVYQQALCMELQAKGVRYVSEEIMPILYKGVSLGGGLNHRLDVALLSYLPFIFELKAIKCPIGSEQYWQLVRYMAYKKQPYGAVVNFSQAEKGSLEIQFIVNHEGRFFLYDVENQCGTLLVDYGL
jgi:GxxExxY protein